MTAEPTLADDEERLAAISADLGAGLDRQVPRWLRGTAMALAPELAPERLDLAITETMTELSPLLRDVLAADVDAGAGSPLAAVRATTSRVTALLEDAGVPPAPRDAFDAQAFPDDLYALGPAAFADIDPVLHELGLMWGAARAHVHLRRRRELEG